jgi:hypothetical protein
MPEGKEQLVLRLIGKLEKKIQQWKESNESAGCCIMSGLDSLKKVADHERKSRSPLPARTGLPTLPATYARPPLAGPPVHSAIHGTCPIMVDSESVLSVVNLPSAKVSSLRFFQRQPLFRTSALPHWGSRQGHEKRALELQCAMEAGIAINGFVVNIGKAGLWWKWIETKMSRSQSAA